MLLESDSRRHLSPSGNMFTCLLRHDDDDGDDEDHDDDDGHHNNYNIDGNDDNNNGNHDENIGDMLMRVKRMLIFLQIQLQLL